MIVTVTMNPAIDKTVEIDSLQPGGLNRIKRVEYDAGGKGINVSKTIRELGGESIAAGFLGGNAGRTIEHVLKEKEIQGSFVRVQGETRTNTKVFEQNGEVTELNEPGPVIGREELEELKSRLLSMRSPGCCLSFRAVSPAGWRRRFTAISSVWYTKRELKRFWMRTGICLNMPWRPCRILSSRTAWSWRGMRGLITARLTGSFMISRKV